MKQIDIVHAYTAAQKLNNQDLPAMIAKKVFMLIDKLKVHFDFQIQEEEKIYKAHPSYDLSVGGIVFDKNDTEARENAIKENQEIAKAFTELSNIEVEDIDFETVIIPESIQNGIQISGKEIGYLKPFIEFE